MATIHTVFDKVVMREIAETYCSNCNKKIKKSVSRSYYRNGFHNESETIKNYELEIKQEVALVKRNGVVCKACSDEINDLPILVRQDKDNYIAKDRQTNKKLVTIYRVENCGWVKWRTKPMLSKADQYGGYTSLASAQEYIRNKFNPKRTIKLSGKAAKKMLNVVSSKVGPNKKLRDAVAKTVQTKKETQ